MQSPSPSETLGGSDAENAPRPTVSVFARYIHGWSWQAVNAFLLRVFMLQILIDIFSFPSGWAQARYMLPLPVWKTVSMP